MDRHDVRLGEERVELSVLAEVGIDGAPLPNTGREGRTRGHAARLRCRSAPRPRIPSVDPLTSSARAPFRPRARQAPDRTNRSPSTTCRLVARIRAKARSARRLVEHARGVRDDDPALHARSHVDPVVADAVVRDDPAAGATARAAESGSFATTRPSTSSRAPSSRASARISTSSRLIESRSRISAGPTTLTRVGAETRSDCFDRGLLLGADALAVLLVGGAHDASRAPAREAAVVVDPPAASPCSQETHRLAQPLEPSLLKLLRRAVLVAGRTRVSRRRSRRATRSRHAAPGLGVRLRQCKGLAEAAAAFGR